MEQLAPIQLVLIGLVFVWSGFVRSGLGFGGAVLALPFLLLIHNDPLLFLPLIAVHLLIFSSWMAITNHRKVNRGRAKSDNLATIDWKYLKYALLVMIIPKLVGVFGLLTMPAKWMTSIIFVVVFVYAIGYVLNRPFKSNSKILDAVFLMLGGYISGASLIGAPLIVAVFASHVAKEQLRDTLFVLWFILVLIKVSAFALAGVDFQWLQHLWLLPLVTIGHVLGQQFHLKLVNASTGVFYRFIGSVLLLISILGLYKAWLV
ncbi:permease ['Osedax' symbiont bacterium Rs2_46_30_T18]|nr:permease ['Osedax' symbiont bacterium Rs2_46_30_T18]